LEPMPGQFWRILQARPDLRQSGDVLARH
jgi:hypothetical protein